jgi:hypothetical protein
MSFAAPAEKRVETVRKYRFYRKSPSRQAGAAQLVVLSYVMNRTQQ